MLKFKLAMPDIEVSDKVDDKDMNKRFFDTKSKFSSRHPAVFAVMLGGAMLISGCQQQADTQPLAEDNESTGQMSEEDTKPMPQSDAAAERIEQMQPIYVTQFQGLQRRLQAEYESLQAADTAESADSVLSNESANDVNSGDTIDNSRSDDDSDSESALTPVTTSQTDAAAMPESERETVAAPDINTSSEVGERDLTVLKRISLEPRKPVMLTEEQTVERYQKAMEALYQPATTPLSAEDTDTLINIATLVPQLFEHAEIAGRVSRKSPALARLIVQHQVRERIKAQQVIDMQQMKIDQQQDFEMLMAKFNETIQGYDEQIAKYEQRLNEFQ